MTRGPDGPGGSAALPAADAFSAHPRSAPGRADLLRALVWGQTEALTATASWLGFALEPSEETIDAESEPEESKETPPRAELNRQFRPRSEPTNFREQQAAPAIYWQPIAREYVADERDDVRPAGERKPLQEADLEPPEGAIAPEPPPIVAWPRLRRALERHLKNPTPRKAVDVPELVRQWSRGRLVKRIPYRAGRAHARVAFYLDRSERLKPFWSDQVGLVRQLARHFGRTSLRRLPSNVVTEGLPLLAPDERVLILGDLGLYSRDPKVSAPSVWMRRWERFGRETCRAGAGKPVALIPCPKWRWQWDGARPFEALDWGTPDRAGGTPRPPEEGGDEEVLRSEEPIGDPDGAPQGLLKASETEDPQAPLVEQVLHLASVAYRLETGLIREIRSLVPEADLGTEVALWAHPALRSAQAIGIVIEESQARRWRQEWADALSNPDSASAAREQLQAVAGLLGTWHRETNPETYAAEIANLLSLGLPKECLDAKDIARSVVLLERITHLIDQRAGELTSSADAWLYRLSGWCSSTLWREEPYREGLARAFRRLRKEYADLPLPPGVTPEMLETEEQDLPIQRYGIWQAGDGFRTVPYSESAAGSLVGLIEARQPKLEVDTDYGPPESVSLGDSAHFPAPPSDRSLLLVTDVEALELAPYPKPEWAVAAGRDRFGFWATAEIAKVEARFRWIPPGRFRMGSPLEEEGRFDWEMPPRMVTLSQGFWFAETPTTQEIWKAVTGENPSRFKSPERPVDQVGWQDCIMFASRLTQAREALQLRLPTEAEWEYACRAGTLTSTYTGELEILGARDAPLLDPIAWYSGNSGVDFDMDQGFDSSGWKGKQYPHLKAGTRKVGQKKPNCWGLQDTLGNVNEWCADCWAEGTEVQGTLDPVGPVSGSRRVFRGGSWYSNARYVRAAGRYWYVPGYRYDDVGFRLAQGPGRGAQRLGKGAGSVRGGTTSRSQRPGWSVAYDEDDFGRWAMIRVDEVEHRLRWIPPGRFAMGSPESEEGRWSDEGPQREVTITKGFWLGETPCTQALWAAVMEANPSRFQDPLRPVERVSWEDCQEFLARIAERIPKFHPRLPTEAEWEYACRAGTKTSTYAGELEILGQRNGPLLDTIAWYGGNSGVDFDLKSGYDSSEWREKQFDHQVAGSRRVGLKGKSAWGLYDMLGNVEERCSDYWGDSYNPDETVDPQGPDSGSLRVIRGGSWYSFARSVRAAYRLWRGPGRRNDDVGFRLAQGPEESGA